MKNPERFKVSVETARELAQTIGVLIHWRPETNCSEAEQYCLVAGQRVSSAPAIGC